MEFQEVMKQWTRARKAMGYGDDPLIKLPTCLLNEDDFSKLEQEVITWAAKHPEPVYPTFREWLTTLYFQSRKPVEGGHEGFDTWMNRTRIPDELAKKLGLEPKG